MKQPFAPIPGFVSDDTVFSTPGRWRTGSMVRFFEANWQTIGGWESLTLDILPGVCRKVHGWSGFFNGVSGLTIAFGQHDHLHAWNGGLLSDITPVLATPVTLGANPIATTNTLTTVVVTDTAHDLQVGDPVSLSGASAVATVTINGNWTVSAVTTNTWSFVAGSAANATTTGGGSVVIRTATRGFVPGQIDGTGGDGYSTGAYGVGAYSEPSTADYFPLTWSLDDFETGDLYANPRHQTIYRWQQDQAVKAAPLANAPAICDFMLIVPQRQVMALACTVDGGAYDPLNIRWSDIEAPTVWSDSPTNNAGSYVLAGGGRLVSGVVLGDYVVLWTDSGCYLGTYIGDPGETWRFTQLGRNCGIIGPLAYAVGAGNAQTVMWISPDSQFWSYSLGGAPAAVDCPMRKEFSDNLALGQNDKIAGGTITQFQEVKWFYADQRDGTGLEISRDITLSKDGWCHGQLARTAFVDAPPSVPTPVGVTYGGNIYWQESGNAADGAMLTGFIESTDFYIQEGEASLLINGIWPNFKDQTGPLSLTIYAREYPQATERVHGPFVLAPGQSKKSFRLSGRILRVRWDFSSVPAYVRNGKQEFDVSPIGSR